MLQPLQAGDLVISTALASRGTDIAVSETVENLSDGGGGLHVLITYLPSNSRVERQIVGRTGRKGLSGSTKTIVCMERLTEELGELEKFDGWDKNVDIVNSKMILGLSVSFKSRFSWRFESIICHVVTRTLQLYKVKSENSVKV